MLFTANISGIAWPQWKRWVVDSSDVGWGDSWIYTPTVTGFHTVYFYCYGEGDVKFRSNVITLNVYAYVFISANSTHVEQGESVLFTSDLSGVLPPYSLQWFLDSAPVLGEYGDSWIYTPTVWRAFHTVYLLVIGEGGETWQSNTVTFEVYPHYVPAFFISANSTNIELGDSVFFWANISRLQPPNSPSWWVNTTQIYGEWEDGFYTLTYTPTVEGICIVRCYVSGEGGGFWPSDAITLTVSVESRLPEGLTIGIMMLLSAATVIVSTSYFRRIRVCSREKRHHAVQKDQKVCKSLHL